MFLNTVTAARAAFLTRMENTTPRRRKAQCCAPAPIMTAEALRASGLSGDDLEEAFDALALKEQSRYLSDSCLTGSSSDHHRYYGEHC